MDRVSMEDLKSFQINRELHHREIDRDFLDSRFLPIRNRLMRMLILALLNFLNIRYESYHMNHMI